MRFATRKSLKSFWALTLLTMSLRLIESGWPELPFFNGLMLSPLLSRSFSLKVAANFLVSQMLRKDERRPLTKLLHLQQQA